MSYKNEREKSINWLAHGPENGGKPLASGFETLNTLLLIFITPYYFSPNIMEVVFLLVLEKNIEVVLSAFHNQTMTNYTRAIIWMPNPTFTLTLFGSFIYLFIFPV